MTNTPRPTLARWRAVITTAVALVLAGCMAIQPETALNSLLGEWRVEQIQGRPVIDYSPASISFSPASRFSGNSSCNRMLGDYTQHDSRISLAVSGTTRMACVPALMEQEQRLIAALQRVATFQMRDSLLFLNDAQGAPLIRLSR